MKNQAQIVAITYTTAGMENYINWFKSFGYEVKVLLSNNMLRLQYADIAGELLLKHNVVAVNSINKITNCSLLVLSGGSSLTIDELRDDFESKQLDIAIHNCIPVFGICRGMQLINRHFNGEIDDVSSIHNHKAFSKQRSQMHSVMIFGANANKWLGLSQDDLHRFEVNSRHSQCVTKLADELVEVALNTDDNCMEILQHNTLPIFAVQFHPERDDCPIQMRALCATGLHRLVKYGVNAKYGKAIEC